MVKKNKQTLEIGPGSGIFEMDLPEELKEPIQTDFNGLFAAQTGNMDLRGKCVQHFKIKSKHAKNKDKTKKSKPDKETVILPDEALLDDESTYQRSVDQYVGPFGNGFTAHYTYQVDDQFFAFAKQCGPEVHRNSEIHEYIPEQEEIDWLNEIDVPASGEE